MSRVSARIYLFSIRGFGWSGYILVPEIKKANYNKYKVKRSKDYVFVCAGVFIYVFCA